jgi:hypothetical protein
VIDSCTATADRCVAGLNDYQQHIGAGMTPEQTLDTLRAICKRIMTPERKLDHLKVMCKVKGVRYYVNKQKKYYQLKPLRTTKDFCNRLSGLCDRVMVEYWPASELGRNSAITYVVRDARERAHAMTLIHMPVVAGEEIIAVTKYFINR